MRLMSVVEATVLAFLKTDTLAARGEGYYPAPPADEVIGWLALCAVLRPISKLSRFTDRLRRYEPAADSPARENWARISWPPPRRQRHECLREMPSRGETFNIGSNLSDFMRTTVRLPEFSSGWLRHATATTLAALAPVAPAKRMAMVGRDAPARGWSRRTASGLRGWQYSGNRV